MTILGIETSCDETSAAVVKDGREVLSNVVSSQIDLHRPYGGVVPEIAARRHIDTIDFITDAALEEASVTLKEIDGVAVANGPGLVGALLVGVSYAKGLAYSLGVPLIGVEHIEAHICANYLDTDWTPPFLSLVVSGGHTSLIAARGYCEYEILGRTRDDAAGEAFDKAARVLGLPYPGGPQIDALSSEGDPNSVTFPKPSFKGTLDEATDQVCEKCGKPMVKKLGRFGFFLACSGFPECRNTKSIPLAKCPKCSGDVVARKTKGRGKEFYGCTNYPECDFISHFKPIKQNCPKCGKFMVEKYDKKNGSYKSCINPECDYLHSIDEELVVSPGGADGE